MSLFSRISKFATKPTYCRFRAQSFSQKQSRKLKQDNENDEILCKNPSKKLYEKYDNKLLFNSIIEANRLNYGYKQNAEFISKARWFEERIKLGLQTVQPLPLTLKYAMDNDTDILQKSTGYDSASNVTQECKEETDQSATNFPYNINTEIGNVDEHIARIHKLVSIKAEIEEKKKLLDENKENWMTHYENFENDLESAANDELLEESDRCRINYGTPDPNCPISNVPCGGCGAYLHCTNTAIPGYIPSEIYKNSHSPGGADLNSILCQRCHFLKEYNIALQVRVSPEDYPKILQTVSFTSAMAILIVDLTDFPCSIWPGIADILGSKSPVVVVGNKVDLLPKDSPKFLNRVREVLQNQLKICGFATSNVKHIELISAKTGYGVENLITALQSIWKRKGDVYLIGCTNVGKSSLYNILLESDFCKIQAADLIQRATTSPWPGTTLNLLKFPITRISSEKVYLRYKRLQALRKIEAKEQKVKSEALQENNSPKNATLMGHIERTFTQIPRNIPSDDFSTQGNANMTGKTKIGINEMLPDYAFGKWCYDTPGVVHPDQILDLLTTEELVQTLPNEIIRPETFCVKPGMSLFIGGLARLDFTNGQNSVRLTVFRAKSLPVTICKTEEADQLYNELLGTELFTVPILKGDRKQNWPGLELTKTFTVFGKNVKESCYDVVLSSAGWVAINCGLAEHEFSAWTPQKRGVHIRDSLLPKAVLLRGARIRSSVAYKKHRFI